MIDTDGRQYLNFKKYKMRSFNPNIKHLRIKENSLIVKLAEYQETDEIMVVSVSDQFDAKTPDQVDVTDVKILQGSKQIQVQLATEHQKDYLQYVWCLDGEQLAEDGSNAFFLISDAQWNAEELAIASDHELPNADDYFIGTFAPLTNYINDLTGCRILLREVKGDLFPKGDITMFLNTPEYSFLQKITGKTMDDEGEIDFNQRVHIFKNDQNVAPTKVVPLGFQGDGKINLYMPWMDTKRILDGWDVKYLTMNKGNDMLKKWIKNRTGSNDTAAATVLGVYEACTRITQSFLNDFENYRITQLQFDGWTADQKNKHHVGDIMPGQKIYGMEASTIANQKTVSAANDRVIDKWRANHPDWQEEDSEDWRLYVCLQKLLAACSTHCVTRFSVEADMTEKHRYYLPYFLTVSLPVKPDTAFQSAVEHQIKSAWYNVFEHALNPGDPLYDQEVAFYFPYKERTELKLSTPYVANLEDTEVEPILPETLVQEDLNKIAGALSKGTVDYLKYLVHVPNDKDGGLTLVPNLYQLANNSPNLGTTSTATSTTVTSKIPNTKWYWGSFQPLRGQGAAGGLSPGGRPKIYEGKTYIMPLSGWDIHSNSLQLDQIGVNSRADKQEMATIIDKNELYKPNQIWWEFKPKIEAGDITIDTDPFRMDLARTATWVNGHLVPNAQTMLYNKADLEKQVLKDLGFGSTKPKGWTFTATPEIATALNQWQKVDRLFGSYPFDDASEDVHVYRWRDITATWTLDRAASTDIVTSQPVVFDKLEWTNRRRAITGETKGIDVELSSTRTEIDYTDLTEIFITGIWLDQIDISFSVPNITGVNDRTLDFNLKTDVKYDEKISSVRILF